VQGSSLFQGNATVTGTNSAAYFTGNGAGITNINLSPNVMLFAVLTNNLAISNNIEQRIWFNNIIASSSIGYTTNGGIFITNSGVYGISATTAWQSVNGSSAAQIYLVKGGQDILHVQSNPAATNSLSLNGFVSLNAGDTLDFHVWQNSGSSVLIAGSSSAAYRTFLSCWQVR
jgi:hypothetical protein